MKTNYKNNKGSFFEVIFVVGMVLLFALVILLTLFLTNKINENSTTFLNENESEVISNYTTRVNSVLDYAFLFIFLVLVIGIIITSFLFYSHPIFTVLWILLSIGGIFVSAVVSNLFSEVSSAPAFSSIIGYMKITSFILNYLPLFTLAIIVISIIIIYSKSQTGGGI